MLCQHDHIHMTEWDNGVDPETGYHDAGALFRCLDCDEAFTEDDFRREMDSVADELEAERKI